MNVGMRSHFLDEQSCWRSSHGRGIRSGQDDVVDWDEDKLDQVADGAHDDEAHDACLQDFHVFVIVWLLALAVEHAAVFDEALRLCDDALLLLWLVGST